MLGHEEVLESSMAWSTTSSSPTSMEMSRLLFTREWSLNSESLLCPPRWPRWLRFTPLLLLRLRCVAFLLGLGSTLGVVCVSRITSLRLLLGRRSLLL